MGSTPVGGSEKSFSEYFDLRTLLHYLHFIQVTIHLLQCEDYSEQSKRYFEPLTFAEQRCSLKRECFNFVYLHFH